MSYPSITSRPTLSYPIQADDGTLSQPTYAFFSDSGTGMYSSGAGDVKFAASGALQLTIDGTSSTFSNNILATNGNFSAPAYSFASAPTSGFFAVGPFMGLSISSTSTMIFSSTGFTSLFPFTASTGNAAACSVQVSGSGAGTGLYSAGSNVLGISAGGTSQLSISSTSSTFTNKILAPNGSFGAPSYSFANQPTTGLFSSGAYMGVSVGGATTQLITSTALVTITPIYAFDGSSTAPTYSFNNSTTTGMYSPGPNIISLTVSGSPILSLMNAAGGFLRCGYKFRVGANTDSLNVTDFNVKTAKFTTPHYRTNNDLEVSLIGASNDGVDNTVRIGGGSASEVCSTRIIFYSTTGNESFTSNVIATITDAGMDLASHKITSLANPVNSTDAANKAYVDSVATGLTVKSAARVATTGNITLSGTQTIDGIAVVASDRVLVKNQTTASQNGLYVVSAGAWTRATDADVSAEVTSGMYCLVTSGSVNGGQGWILTTPNPITLNTTSLTFAQFSSSASYVQGTGIVISGNTVSLDTTYSDTRYINTTGDTMSGALAMGGNVITGLGTPTAATDATTKTYVDTAVAAKLARSDLKLLSFSGDADVVVSDTHDSGFIMHTDGIIRTYTLGTGGSVGLTTTIVNNSGTSVSIVQGASTTLRETGTTNTGTRTLGAYGMATAVKVASGVWFISGGVLS
jgi:hypothetical protein